jgi:DNA-binding FadR family transcriptional regulator
VNRRNPARAERRTLSQAVTEALLDRVRAGEFRPGDRLPTEKELMAEYGVGRNAAREAIQALVAMGLIEVRPGRGATLLAVEASGIDADTVRALLSDEAAEHLYEFRRLVEVEAAARAAERATDDDLAEMKAALTRWRRAVTRAGGSYTPLDDEFHAAIARASHNPLFETMLEAVRDLIVRGRQLATQMPGILELTLTEHQEIYDAIESRDADRAARAMGAHLDSAIGAIRTVLRSRED